MTTILGYAERVGLDGVPSEGGGGGGENFGKDPVRLRYTGSGVSRHLP